MDNMNSHNVNADVGLHIIFVDSEVDNYQDLISGSRAEIVLLDSDRNGIEQITETLAQSSNVSTVEILSHGRDNSINLGNSQLNADNVEQYRTKIASWSAALTENSDILIHGCNVAADVDGSDLITQLADLTSADIAASNNVTGSNAAGGDWVLEVVTGEIESQTALNSEGMNNYSSLLLTYNDSEYQLTSPDLTWLEAQAEAESLGGNLVSINDAAEQQWIVDNFAVSTARWIGLSDRNTEGEFEWSDGSTVDYTNWRINQPDDYGAGEDYGSISSFRNGGWNDLGDSSRLQGIVEIDRDDTVEIDSDDTVELDLELPDPTQTYFNRGSEYRLTSNTTWEQAQNEAEAAGGNLITINDVIEKQWVSQTFGTDRPYWTGLSDRDNEGEFTWVSGENSPYRNWQPNQPDSSTSDEDYTVINATPGDDRWNDVSNDESFYGIIEIPRSAGTISLADSNYTVSEDGGAVEVEVLRTGGDNGTVSVNYRTQDGSAQADSDYVSGAGTITFAPGETSKTINIPIIDDFIFEANESFSLVLDSVTGGATLNDPRTASIEITGFLEPSAPNPSDPGAGDLLPDLQIIESSIGEGFRADTTTQPGRVLLRFTTEVANAGDGALEVWADEAEGNTQDVFQRIYQADGTSRDVEAGGFTYFEPHGHSHFDDFALFNLREVNADGSVGELVASGDSKYSFCLLNIRQPFPELTENAIIADGRGGSSCDDVQGISVGYSDVYNSNLENQWIDITGVPDGDYWLETIIDPENRLLETNDDNNVSRVRMTIG